MRIILLLGIIILFSITITGQITINQKRNDLIDTIYVNDNTSYLLFNHDIYNYGVSNLNDFTALAHENCLQIRAKTLTPGKMASVFVTYGDSTYKQYHYAYLLYDPGQMNEFYDYRDDFYKTMTSKIQKKKQIERNKEDEENFFISELKTRAKNILNMKDEMDMGNTENNLSLLCRLIRIDKEYAYIKMEFINQSAVDYNFEKVSFQYEEKFRQGFLKRKKIKYLDVWPVITPEKLLIEAYTKRSIVYVIPTYGLNDHEKLLITFREQGGGRKIALGVDSEIISSSKLLFK
ncbi:MAG: conjugative transposon protein TraN [Carboxylicivirga sp.]|jgi:hypothetical protein|nr:conjugative transposon protein TraN [Carboxylicivirga sp.]